MRTPERIAITGASGFVGGWLRRRLEKTGAEVVSLLGEGGGDIRDARAVAAAIGELRPAVIVHLAAVAAPAHARNAPGEAWDVNLLGTLHLARAVIDHCPDAFLLFVGSADAYGDSMAAGVPVSEEAPLAPRSVYGATKAAADVIIGQMAAEGLGCVRLRPFNHTGPGQMETYVASSFARQIALAEKGRQPAVVRVGDLDAERDFLDVRDVVEAYAAAIERREAIRPGTPVNVATGRPVRVGELLDILRGLATIPIEVETDPARLRPSELRKMTGDSRRARELLGWSATIPLERTLSDVLDYWRRNVAPS
jgi:GDP-4-dehydro-6-deoxy-D-mannose reductase